MSKENLDYFVSTKKWLTSRPHIMVVACSDGRYQESLDEFLRERLGIQYYDRLYAPGGPGVMASSLHSYFRGDQFRQEATFLIDAHQLEEIILIFHGPALPDGPVEATCADYRRKMPYGQTQEINQQQQQDIEEVQKAINRDGSALRLSAYRSEARADGRVQFVPLDIPVTE